MAPNLELKISVGLDQNGVPFVKGVERMTAQAEEAVTKSGGKMRQSLSEIFARGFFIRAGLAALALQRFGQAADQPSERLRRFNQEGKQTAAIFGNEVQAAIGATLAPLTPLVTKLKEGDGALRGMAAGGAAFLSVGINIIKLLIQLGTKANVAVALVSLAFLGGGAALGKFGEKAKEEEDAINDLYDSIKAGNPTLDENKRRIEELKKAYDDLAKARNRGFDTVEGEGFLGLRTTSVALPQRDFEAEQQNLDREMEARKRINDDLETEITYREELQKFIANPTPETSSDAISRLNAQIALGKTTLADARQEIRNFSDDVKGRLAALTSESGGVGIDKLIALSPERQKALEKAKDDAEKQKIFDEQRVDLERTLVSLDQFRAELGDRIATQTEKERSEALNRLKLQAQIADIVANQGPVLERQVIQEQIRNLLAQGHKENEIEVLQLRLEELKLTGELLQLETKEADEAQRRADERRRAREEDAKSAGSFRDRTVGDLNILGGSTDLAERQRRIRELQNDLKLTSLSVDELNQKFLELSSPRVHSEAGEEDRRRFGELLGLLQTEAEASGAFAREQLATVKDAAQSASRAMGQAFVSMFDTTEDGAKALANTIKQIFLQMAGELIGNAIFQLLLSFFTGGGSTVVGSIVGGGVRGGGGILGGFRVPSTPSINLPSLGGWSNGSQQNDTAGLRKDIRALTKALTNSQLQSGEVTLDGEKARILIHRAEQSAAKRRLT